ncbi:phospholipid carrier-dependent glycosyltransferase [Patescibacteria group bacterium]|nr:phospholipid carrier-dependent glycosyltransferase [Patescibacteria group bacterium]MCL5091924.1 phospholipid carrier-dependent glycosyltransferase [Patescibacteria group bacterium]
MKQRRRGLLIAIFLLAALLRFNNLNWDSGFHLHPDERFLTMVANATAIPSRLTDYFNPSRSRLNPANVGFHFYVYGTLPLTLNKIAAVWFNHDNYNDFTVQGRWLAGWFDLMVVGLVYRIAAQLVAARRQRDVSALPYWAAFFYAIAVLPIQLAHFFTVDPFLNFFMILSFYLLLRWRNQGRPLWLLSVSAVALGLAFACKVNAVFILPLNLALIGLTASKNSRHRFGPVTLALVRCLVYVLLVYLALRCADPYVFRSSAWLDPRPNPEFVANLQQLKSYESKDVWYPPAIQWINKPPVIFSLVNLAVFGVGLPYFFLLGTGLLIQIKRQAVDLIKTLKKRSKPVVARRMLPASGLIAIWVVGFFLYQSTRFVKTMRYFIFLYPFLAIYAAMGVESVTAWTKRFNGSKSARRFYFPLLVSAALVWPLMFFSIYLRPNSRVAASDWIYQHLRDHSLILYEYWDDGLPLPVANPTGKQFRSEAVAIFDPDTPEKWSKISAQLGRADYYIMSSNRGWGSIPTVPDKYPVATRFYRDLLAGKLGYQKLAEFNSYPQLCWSANACLVWPDDWADEAFTVYDHPRVLIYENEKTSRAR